MKYEKAVAELVVIDSGDVITKSCLSSSEECDFYTTEDHFNYRLR